jgi:hypothetical protein
MNMGVICPRFEIGHDLPREHMKVRDDFQKDVLG